MGRYKEDLKFAYKMVALAAQSYDEGNPFGYVCLLCGIGPCSVGKIGKEHKYRAVIDAMHSYKKNNPTKPVAEAFQVALSKAIKAVAAPQAVDSLFNIYEYELIKEKSGTNSFVLDFAPVLKDMEKLERRRGISRKKRAQVLGEDYALRLAKLKESVAAVHPNVYNFDSEVNSEKKSKRKKWRLWGNT